MAKDVESTAAEEQATPPAEASEEAPAPGESATARVEELERELEAAREKADENWESVLRARAELENVRKRSQREVENAHKYGLERFMSELLAVRDSIQLGLEAARAEDADAAKLREGLELTLKLFDAAGAKFGLEEVDPAGEPFDPQLHEAMSMQPSADAESGTVLRVVQKGYRLNDRLLRPAMVIVAE